MAAAVSFAATVWQSAPVVPWKAVADGVEHAEFVRTASGPPDGPWNINALRLDPTRVRLDVVRAMDEAVGAETVSSIAARRGALAAVNGGYFRTTGTFRGDTLGTVQIDGTILSEPDRARAAVGFVRDGVRTRLIFGHVVWTAVVMGGRARRALDGVNRPCGDNEVVLFTPWFHRTTLTDARGTEVIVRAGRVAEIRRNAGSSIIPGDGFVLSARGAAEKWLLESVARGTAVRVSLALEPAEKSPRHAWSLAEDVLGAGPMLVTDGRVDITYARESMLPTFSTDRHPRTALATLGDGRVLLAVVDGRQPGISVGMSLDELARLLIEVGAREAINLDGGGSSTMVVDGKVVNHPSDATGERPVGDAIVVSAQRTR